MYYTQKQLLEGTRRHLEAERDRMPAHEPSVEGTVRRAASRLTEAEKKCIRMSAVFAHNYALYNAHFVLDQLRQQLLEHTDSLRAYLSRRYSTASEEAAFSLPSEGPDDPPPASRFQHLAESARLRVDETGAKMRALERQLQSDPLGYRPRLREIELLCITEKMRRIRNGWDVDFTVKEVLQEMEIFHTRYRWYHCLLGTRKRRQVLEGERCALAENRRHLEAIEAVHSADGDVESLRRVEEELNQQFSNEIDLCRRELEFKRNARF